MFNKQLLYSLLFFVEEHSGPAWYEPRLPGEPQKNQQGEDNQHTALCEAHPAQLFVLIFDYLVSFAVITLLRAASKGLSQAGITQCENELLFSIACMLPLK